MCKIVRGSGFTLTEAGAGATGAGKIRLTAALAQTCARVWFHVHGAGAGATGAGKFDSRLLLSSFKSAVQLKDTAPSTAGTRNVA